MFSYAMSNILSKTGFSWEEKQNALGLVHLRYLFQYVFKWNKSFSITYMSIYFIVFRFNLSLPLYMRPFQFSTTAASNLYLPTSSFSTQSCFWACSTISIERPTLKKLLWRRRVGSTWKKWRNLKDRNQMMPQNKI